jgi:hypothetical protein
MDSNFRYRARKARFRNFVDWLPPRKSSRSAEVSILRRYRRFESIPLQRRVYCKPMYPTQQRQATPCPTTSGSCYVLYERIGDIGVRKRLPIASATAIPAPIVRPPRADKPASRPARQSASSSSSRRFGHARVPTAGYRPDHGGTVELATFDPHRAEEAAADVGRRIDDGVGREARRDRFEIGDSAGRGASGHSGPPILPEQGNEFGWSGRS